MELIRLHDERVRQYDILTQCCSILNAEWPRSDAIRRRTLEASKEDLPMCLALVQWMMPSRVPCVTGHVRLSRIPSLPHAVWIESIVLHPDVRGKGLGKYLLLLTEHFCKNELGFREAYLCTIDQHIFYSRCGYRPCDPVCAYGGNIHISSNLLGRKSEILDAGSYAAALSRSVPRIQTPIPAPPPPPPPSLPSSKDSQGQWDAICKQHYSRPSLPERPPLLLDQPLRPLIVSPRPVVNGPPPICRVTLAKTCMTKVL